LFISLCLSSVRVSLFRYLFRSVLVCCFFISVFLQLSRYLFLYFVSVLSFFRYSVRYLCISLFVRCCISLFLYFVRYVVI